jgi:hypothetical protein
MPACTQAACKELLSRNLVPGNAERIISNLAGEVPLAAASLVNTVPGHARFPLAKQERKPYVALTSRGIRV